MTRNGRPAAVVVSAEECESLKETREIKKDPDLMKELKQSLVQLEKDHRFSIEEVCGTSSPLLKRKN